jgi:hypothetical protein
MAKGSSMKLPQLSLRELFLLVPLAAMGCGWWMHHRNSVQRAELLVNETAEQKTNVDRLLSELRGADRRVKAAEQEASRLSSLILIREDRERRLRSEQADRQSN